MRTKNFQTYKLDLEKAEEPEIKFPTSTGSQKKQGNFRKTSTSASLTMLKLLTVWITATCGKFLKGWENQTILPASCETCMRVKKQQLEPTEHGKTNWFQTGKGVRQGRILLPCLFNLYADYIMQNAGLDEAQAGIKIAGRNINNLRYADDTSLMAENEELQSLLMKVKEESEKVGLKLNIRKTNIIASSPITPRQIDGDSMETVTDFIFFWLKNHFRC